MPCDARVHYESEFQSMKRLIPLFLLAAALGLAACGGKTLDTKNVESDIKEIADQGGAETEPKCPDEVEDVEDGTTYECDIVFAGNENNTMKVEMKVNADDESEFVDQKVATDEIAIRSIIATTDEDPAKICDHMSPELKAAAEADAGDECEAAAASQAEEEPANIKSVKVNGDTATVVSDKSTSTLERSDDGAWVITAIE
jgi:hypothetical protein